MAETIKPNRRRAEGWPEGWYYCGDIDTMNFEALLDFNAVILERKPVTTQKELEAGIALHKRKAMQRIRQAHEAIAKTWPSRSTAAARPAGSTAAHRPEAMGSTTAPDSPAAPRPLEAVPARPEPRERPER